MIRKILVPVRGDGKGDNVVAHAAVLAKRFSAHIVVTHCRMRPEDLLPFGVPIPGYMRDQLKDQAKELADAEEEKLKSEFSALAERYSLPERDGTSDEGASIEWVSKAGRQIDIIKQFGRLSDLICVAKPDRDRNLGGNTLKAALFHTGRPVLMCPLQADVPEYLGDEVVVAWNGSKEAARAVSQMRVVIATAKKVTIEVVGDGEVHGASSEDLRDYFAMRNVSADIRRLEERGKVGSLLLAGRRENELLIMGAYGDSHESETLFGGNTQTIVDGAVTPVAFVN